MFEASYYYSESVADTDRPGGYHDQVEAAYLHRRIQDDPYYKQLGDNLILLGNELSTVHAIVLSISADIRYVPHGSPWRKVYAESLDVYAYHSIALVHAIAYQKLDQCSGIRREIAELMIEHGYSPLVALDRTENARIDEDYDYRPIMRPTLQEYQERHFIGSSAHTEYLESWRQGVMMDIEHKYQSVSGLSDSPLSFTQYLQACCEYELLHLPPAINEVIPDNLLTNDDPLESLSYIRALAIISTFNARLRNDCFTLICCDCSPLIVLADAQANRLPEL